MSRNQQIAINKRVDFTAAAVDSIDIGTIFSMFLKESLHHLLEQYLKFILFPIAAIGNIIRAGLAWRQAKLEGGKKDLIARAIVETLGAIAITTAVLGGLLFATTFVFISPLIFASTLSAKALFSTGAAIFHLVQSVRSKDQKEKGDERQKAIGNAAVALANGLAACAVIGVMLAGKIALAAAGIASGIVGTAFAIFKLCHSLSARAKGSTPLPTHTQEEDTSEDKGLAHENTLTQNAQLAQTLRQSESKQKEKGEKIEIIVEKPKRPIESPKPYRLSEKNLFTTANAQESTNEEVMPQSTLRRNYS